MDPWSEFINWLTIATSQNYSVLNTINIAHAQQTLLNFVNINSNAWIGKFEMSLDKCVDKTWQFSKDLTIYLQEVFKHLKPIDLPIFWKHVCNLIGRNEETIELEVNNLIDAFINDVANINMSFTPLQVKTMVANGKSAILAENASQLGFDLSEISEEDKTHFFAYLRKIWNTMNPQDQITGFAIGNTLKDLFSGIDPNADLQSTASKIFSQILQTNFVSQLAGSIGSIVQDGKIDLKKIGLNLNSL